MTRRGSLVYYLSAWVIGCFVFSLLPWFHNRGAINSGVSHNFLFVYFITLIVGAPDVLILAFLLRLIIRFGGGQSAWLWAVEGAILGFSLTFVLAWAEVASRNYPGFEQGMLHIVYQMFLDGPRTLRDSGPLAVVGAGAVVGVVLHLVDRAFDFEEPSPDQA